MPHTRCASRYAALDGDRFVRPRRLEPDHARRPHLAGRRQSASTALGSLFGVSNRSDVGISLWLGRPGVPAHHDILQALPLLVLALIMTAALGPTLPNVIIAIAISPDPDGRPRDPRQYAGAARASLYRSRQIDRHERDPDRAASYPAQYAGAADRAGHRPARLDHFSPRPRCRFSASASPNPIRPGGACCRNRRPNTSVLRLAGDIFPAWRSAWRYRHHLFGDALRDILDPRQRG